MTLTEACNQLGCHCDPLPLDSQACVVWVGWMMLVVSQSVCLFTVPAGGMQQVTQHMLL